MNRFFTLLWMVVFWLGCNNSKQKAGELVSKSPSGKNRVEVVGTKTSYFSPLSVLLYVQSSVRKDSLWFEMEQEEINRKTCEIDWLNDEEFMVTLWHRDMEKRVLRLQVKPNGVSIHQ